MAINSDFYVHESDRVALDALKAIPGFTPLLKAFMKVWSEKQFYIQNMSTNLRISENQLPKYYHMLPPICEKLGIEVPEMYLELNVVPNAYTFGDTKPFIVLTSGLLDTMPEELIPTVIAHECGHIACRHVLYTTMGRLILSEAINYLGLSDLAVFPIQVAFYYWMRCSEISADRAAAICDGTADKVVEMCMRFAGFGKNIGTEANVDAFMNQALEYKRMMEDSTWNKTMEFIMFSHETHPLNAVRAYECSQWAKTDTFARIREYLTHTLAGTTELALSAYLQELPMPNSSRSFLGRNYLEVKDQLESLGFRNIRLIRDINKGLMTRDGQIVGVLINGRDKVDRGTWIPANAEFVITYYEGETPEEIAAAHPGQLQVPEAAKRCVGRDYREVVALFEEAGFTEILVDSQEKTKKDWFAKEGNVARISVNGLSRFEKGEWFGARAVIRITYYVI